jgi:hypothetical protein
MWEKELLICPKDYKVFGYEHCIKNEPGKPYNLDPGKDWYGYLATIAKVVSDNAGIKIGEEDVVLGKADLEKVQTGFRNLLLQLINSQKQDWTGDTGFSDIILGKKIRLNLRDNHDKLIDEMRIIYDVVDSCVRNEQPLFFSVIRAADIEKYRFPAL